MIARRPLSQRVVLAVGSMGYVGFSPVASGTITVAVWGPPLFYLMHAWPWPQYLAVWAVLTLAAVWLSGRGDQILAEKDSSKMVVDEIVGYQLAVFTLPFTWQILAVSFFLERAIDIAKIPPANIIEDRVPGGWGVVGDDVIAGLYTLAILRLVIYFRPEWLGVS